MGALGWFFDWCKGTDHRPPRRVRMEPVKKVARRARVENISAIPGEPHFEAGGPAVKKHFALIDQINAAWKAKDRAQIVRLCRAQIAIGGEVLAALREESRLNSLPVSPISHTGFERLAMLHEREGDYREAIAVCEEAIAGGWSEPEFAHRAARCRRKLEKG